MKFLVLFCILCVVGFSTQIPLFDGCDENVENLFDKESCIHVQCESFKNETVQVSKMFANSCPIAKCEEGEYKGDTPMEPTKTYPDCCASPICE